ncbi:uncharacterized protein LOC141906945 [Tubulanus polymorphus]|uniref:uncharacterized protein LOC141906945 n=1 Tax=Tubulanus polymorphus TaxID=672921 RepID=UPI003DA4FB58
MKFKRILQGEQALVFNHLGEGRLIKGPHRIFLFRQRLVKLRRHTCTPDQYMVIKNKDGVLSHLPGPCDLYENPLAYDYIIVQDATKIDANHLIVVYKKVKDNVERRIVQGPTVFIPTAEEWLHEFQWHGADPAMKSRMIPGSRTFQKLTTIPENFYYDVRDVRTVDDTMITVKLMLFYEMKDIIKMLEATHDPIADMINAVCADVVAVVGKLSFQDFLKNTSKFSQLETFPQLLQRCERIGFDINKVVYTGYHSSDQLQAMQDRAVQSRTQLRLNAEIQEQELKVKDFKTNREQARTTAKQDIEKSRQAHDQSLQLMKQSHQDEIRLSENTELIKRLDIQQEFNLKCEKMENEAKMEFLSKLSDLGVDLTMYLLSQQEAPVAEEIQLVPPPKDGL